MPPQIPCASALPGETGKQRNMIFLHLHSKLQEGIAWIQLAAWFLQPYDSRLILTKLHDSLNHVINAFSSGLTRGMVHDKRSRELCRSWTVLHAQCTSALSFGCLISQGNAEALDRWGGKTKIAWFRAFSVTRLPKINRVVYVKIIASQRWNVLRHSVEYCSSVKEVLSLASGWQDKRHNGGSHCTSYRW